MAPVNLNYFVRHSPRAERHGAQKKGENFRNRKQTFRVDTKKVIQFNLLTTFSFSGDVIVTPPSSHVFFDYVCIIEGLEHILIQVTLIYIIFHI